MTLPFDALIRRAACHIAALRMQVALARLGLALRGYDPDQPRITAGRSGGGRWTEGDEGDSNPSSDDARIVFVNDGDTRKYSVDLEEEEARGGHTLRDHVGKTDEEMLRRVQGGAWWTIPGRGGPRRDGSFPSRESANDLVNRTLEQNASAVDRVARGEVEGEFLKNRYGFRTGREAYSTEEGVLYMRETYGIGIVIRHDPGSSRGYRVHTAYPRNDGD